MQSDNMRIFGKNLSFYLDRSGKMQKDLAAELGVPPTTFSDWCRGRRMPKIDKIEMLANYFGIEKADLIEDQRNDKNVALSTNRRNLIDLVSKCPEEDVGPLLVMMQIYLAKNKEM